MSLDDMSIDPDVRAKWVAALRSGKYEQGQGSLRREDNTFCCLGVLCDLVDPDVWVLRGHRYAHDEDATAVPSPQIMTRVGLVDPRHVALTTLAGMNDRGKSFAEIADYIEATF